MGIAVFMALTLLPLSMGVAYAALQSFGLVGPLQEGFTGAHWQALLTRPAFWYALAFSLYIALAGTLLAAWTAMSMVIWLKRRARAEIRSLLHFPLIYPSVIIAFFVFQWLSKGGLLSRLAYQANWIDSPNAFPTLVNDAYGWGILLAHFLISHFFFTVYMHALWEKELLQDIWQAAANLGASNKQIKRRLIRPSLFYRSQPVLLLYFVYAFGSYEIPLLLGRSFPQMMAVFTVDRLQTYDLKAVPQAYVAALISAAFIFLLLLLFLKLKRNHA